MKGIYRLAEAKSKKKKLMHVESQARLLIHKLSYFSPTTLLIICSFLSLEQWRGGRGWNAIKSWRGGEVLVIHLQHRNGLMAEHALLLKHKRGNCHCLEHGVTQRDALQVEGVEKMFISLLAELNWISGCYVCYSIYSFIYSSISLLTTAEFSELID